MSRLGDVLMTELTQGGESRIWSGSCQVEACQFYQGVPKGLKANLEYRERLEQAAWNENKAEVLRRMCELDPLFWMNTCVWTFDPRKRPSGIPFITWPFQDRVFLMILNAVDLGEDLLIEKSRDMGASWLCLMAYLYLFLHRSGLTFLAMSRKEDLVDKTGDPDSLFWKLDYVLDRLPSGIRPEKYQRKKHRQRLHFENPDTGSIIDGSATTSDTARGGRRTSILLDEFASVENGNEILASTADATPCRIFNSTPKGTDSAFYLKKCDPNTAKLRLHWPLHPLKSLGLYRDVDGKPRSDWYDRECKRRSVLEVAQELDIDHIASGSVFFTEREVQKHIADCAREPDMIGELEFTDDGKPVRFVRNSRGPLWLWLDQDWKTEDGILRPPHKHNYSLGIDIAAGTGSRSSASTVAIYDCDTMEKVGEYANAYIRPDKFAQLAVALARWFGGLSDGGYLIWEGNGGPAQQFTIDVLNMDYRRCYMRQQEGTLTRRKSVDYVGWYQTRERKEALLGEYRRAMAAGDIKNRSVAALKECLGYCYLKNGGIGVPGNPTLGKVEEHETRHGDRVIADALAVRGIKEQAKAPAIAQEVPVNSVGGRLAIYNASMKESVEW